MARLVKSLTDVALQQVPVAIAVLTGEELRFAFANPAYRRLIGVEGEIEGKRLEAVVPQAEAESGARLRQVLQSGEPYRDPELRSLAVIRHGRPTYWNVQFLPLDADEDGAVDAVAVLALEVTEQVELRQEAELRAQQAEEGKRTLDAIMRYVPEGITIAEGRDVTIRRVSDYGMQLVARPAEQLEGLPAEQHPQAWEIYTPDGSRQARPEEVPLTRAVQRGEVVLGEEWLLRSSDGREICTASNAGPILDGEGRIVGGVVAWRDITELKRVERTLREREALLRLALEAAELGHWEYHPQTGSVHYSAMEAQIHGLPPHAGTTVVSDFYAFIHPDDRDPARLRMEQALASGRELLRNQFRIVRSDGAVRWIGSRCRIERGPDGQPTRMVGIDMDVTDEHLLRQRLERFAQTVAHDLKAPLRSVSLHAELLQRSPATLESATEQILAGCQQIEDLIDGILEYARASRVGTQMQPVALEQALEAARARLRVQLTEANAVLTHGPLPTVSGNLRLLTQAFQNLLANAIKFRAPRPLRIDVTADRSEGGWLVHVKDNGVGIPPERQAEIFAAYQRGPETGAEGLGLGLALVGDAVAHHGGRVWVESAPESGSIFCFTLPDRPAAPQRA